MYWSSFYNSIYSPDDDSAMAREIEKFEKYEYYRKASRGQALFYRVLKEAKVSPCKDLKDLGKYEHARWNVFMRAEGFVRGDKKSFINKTHYDLVDFERLNDIEKSKDLFYDSERGRLVLNKEKK